MCWRGLEGLQAGSLLYPGEPLPILLLTVPSSCLTLLPFNAGYFPVYITNFFPALALRITLSPEALTFYFHSKTSSFSVYHHNSR